MRRTQFPFLGCNLRLAVFCCFSCESHEAVKPYIQQGRLTAQNVYSVTVGNLNVYPGINVHRHQNQFTIQSLVANWWETELIKVPQSDPKLLPPNVDFSLFLWNRECVSTVENESRKMKIVEESFLTFDVNFYWWISITVRYTYFFCRWVIRLQKYELGSLHSTWYHRSQNFTAKKLGAKSSFIIFRCDIYHLTKRC